MEESEAKGMDPKLFIDESLVREVEVSGFIKALYPTNKEPAWRNTKKFFIPSSAAGC